MEPAVLVGVWEILKHQSHSAEPICLSQILLVSHSRCYSLLTVTTSRFYVSHVVVKCRKLYGEIRTQGDVFTCIVQRI